MPRFINKKRNYYLSTSPKVLYTTMTFQEELNELTNMQFLEYLLWDTVRGIHRPQYMLVRNPYDRLVSCFADKFRRSPLKRTPEEGWQSCQRLYFPFLGLSEQDEFEKIRDRLLKVTFSEFMHILPNVIRKEGHFWPQSWMLRARLKKIPITTTLKINRFYRIETDLQKVEFELGLDTSFKMQQSEHGPSDEYFNKKLTAIANNLYRADFSFGYNIKE